jgi:hypothetical protein
LTDLFKGVKDKKKQIHYFKFWISESGVLLLDLKTSDESDRNEGSDDKPNENSKRFENYLKSFEFLVQGFESFTP